MKRSRLNTADRTVSFRACEALLRVYVLGITMPALVAGTARYEAR